MIVIYEQNYDLVSIMDVIEDDKLNEFIEHYKNVLLQAERHQEIVEEKNEEEYGSYSVKVMYSYENNPTEWLGFYYVKFDRMNNYENKTPIEI
jgi:hypothetical protein